MSWRDRPCLEWLGATDTHGYGHRRIDGRLELVHREAYRKANGVIPPGLHVLHHCDNRRCIELTHLWLGTNLDNSRDRHAKGRSASKVGELNGRSKLTDQQRRWLTSQASEGVKRKDLAAYYGVDVSRVGRMVREASVGRAP